MKRLFTIVFLAAAFAFAFVRILPLTSFGPNPEDRRPPPTVWQQGRPPGGPEVPFQRRGPRFGGFRRGGPGGPVSENQQPLRLVAQFDQDGDGSLSAEERKAARDFLRKEQSEGRGRRSPALRNKAGLGTSGVHVAPDSVKTYPDAGLYDPGVLRTIFIDFEDPDWEQELSDFYPTDIAIPAKLTVDGRAYANVGIHCQAAPSSLRPGAAWRLAINLSLDLVQKDQTLFGGRALTLIHMDQDFALLRSVLYLDAARELMPAPKANFVRVVINGENWGIYVNAQPFNKELIKDWFENGKGARWTLSGSPKVEGAFQYLGEKSGDYRRIYDLQTKEDKKAWRGLIELCRVLSETPPEKLEEELSPLLDIDGTLKLLALENAWINRDGSWSRWGGYNLFRDEAGRFHLIPLEINEPFWTSPNLPGNGGVEGIEPLQGADNPARPLLSKLLAAPGLRAKFAGFEREIAAKSLDWDRIGPLLKQYQQLMAADLSRKSGQAFTDPGQEGVQTLDMNGSGGAGAFKGAVQQRREFLLNHPLLKR